MIGPGFLSFQNFLEGRGRGIELLFFWTISQIILVALGVLVIIGINFLKGGLYRYEKAIPYYEVLWTGLPTLILCSVAVPRICLLYSHEQEGASSLTLKCIGHQWYWRYEYRDLEEVEFDRLILPSEDLFLGEPRYLEADNRAVLPTLRRVRCLIGREDVIHAWAIPSAGLKVDATPGRLSLIFLNLNACGVLYGQCRELCGANHSLMPVVVEAATPLCFKEWLNRL